MENQSFLAIKLRKNDKMKAKNLMVSLFAIAIMLCVVSTVSAVDDPYFTIDKVKVDSINIFNDDVVLVAGDTISIEVYFSFYGIDSDVYESDRDVTVTATLDTGKEKVEATTSPFKVAEGTYKKVLTLKVPYELKDELSGLANLELEIEGADYSYTEDWDLTYERGQYDLTVKSVSVDPSRVNAGKDITVDFVVKNTGYYDLEDLYVTVSVPGLDLAKSAYLADLVSDEWNYDDDDETDSVSGSVKLTIPYDVEAGIYTVELSVFNEDTSTSVVGEFVINNDFAETVIQNGNDLIIVNPTDNVKMYKVVVEAPGSASENVVVVQAGSSKTVTIASNADGEYEFDVNVFSGNSLVSTTTFVGEGSADANGNGVTSPIVVLTVVLIIVFVVLLIVLIVLITKKPEKTEEFGESYY